MNLSRLCKALVLPLMVAATAAPAQTPKPVRIGVMTDMAGMTMAIVGPGSVIAAKMAAEVTGAGQRLVASYINISEIHATGLKAAQGVQLVDTAYCHSLVRKTWSFYNRSVHQAPACLPR